MLLEALRQCCDREHGESTYLRLSTKPVEQALLEPALARLGEERLRATCWPAATAWSTGATRAGDGRRPSTLVQIAASGAMIPEAVRRGQAAADEGVAANVLNVTSPGLLYDGLADGPAPRPARRRATAGDAGHLGGLIPPEERARPDRDRPATARRTRSPSSAGPSARRSCRSASTSSASPAPAPTCTASTGSTPTTSSAPRCWRSTSREARKVSPDGTAPTSVLGEQWRTGRTGRPAPERGSTLGRRRSTSRPRPRPGLPEGRGGAPMSTRVPDRAPAPTSDAGPALGPKD